MAIERVKFLGHWIKIVVTDDGQFVPLKPVCEIIGLSWVAQLERTKAHTVLGRRLQELTVPSGRHRDYKMVCIPLAKFDFWLATINAARYENEAIKDRLTQFQEKCADVLYAHFRKGTAPVEGNIGRTTVVQPDIFDTSVAQINDLRTLVAEKDGKIGGLEARVAKLNEENAELHRQLGAMMERQVPTNVVEQERRLVATLRENAELKERMKTMVPRPKLAEPRTTQPRDPRQVIFDD